MTIFMLIHGSWHNGTVWRKVQHLLDGKSVVSYAPTLTGFESFSSPAAPTIGLHTHIQDIVQLIQDRALDQVILVGHSYGGMILSGVADLIPAQIAQLVYLDAFIPDSNQSLFDIMGVEQSAQMRKALVNAEGRSLKDGAESVWLLPPGNPQDYGVSDSNDVAWLQTEMPYTPVLTFEEGVMLGNPAALATPKYFIRCTAFDYLAAQEQKAIAANWKTYQLPTGHDAMVTMPEALVDILLEIAQLPQISS
ncbi:MAG: alpha/beta hydrolase [Chloroflexota bacterium]